MPASSKRTTPGPAQRRPPRDPSERESLINRQLADAVNSSDWGNLKGKGRPLNLEPPPGVPPDMVMAHKIMEDAHVQPSWLEDRNALLAKIEDRRGRWRRGFRRLDDIGPAAARQRAAWAEQARREMADLNRQIRNLNLALPLWRLEIMPLEPDAELARAAAAAGD